MRDIADILEKSILLPKKEKLIAALESVILGKEKNYIPETKNPQYFEIWFYLSFDFRYVIIGYKNYAIDLANEKDEELINSLYEEFKEDYDSLIEAEGDFFKLQKELEFNFFADCWEELEMRIGKKIRCFLIEHGIIRGLDVNKRERVDGELLGEILDEEGIENRF